MALPLRITYSSKRTKNLIILTTNFFLSDLHFCNTKTIQWRFGEFDSLCAVVCHSMSMKFHSQKKEEPKNALHFNAFLCASLCVCVYVCTTFTTFPNPAFRSFICILENAFVSPMMQLPFLFLKFSVFFVVIWNRSIFVGSLGISNILEAYEIDIQWRLDKMLAAYLIALLQNTV